MKLTDKKFWIAWTSLTILIVVWCMIEDEGKAPELHDCNPWDYLIRLVRIV